MRGLLHLGAALVTLLHGYAVFALKLSKPEIRPEFNMFAYDQELMKNLPGRLFLAERWHPDLIPRIVSASVWDLTLSGAEADAGIRPTKFFTSHAENLSYSPFDIDTMDVLYSDCPHYQAVSRHKNYEESWDSIFKRLSKVPVGMRQWTGNILFLPVGSTSAYQLGSSIVFTKNMYTLGVAAHEFSHVLDQFALADVVEKNGYKLGTRYSETSMWADAYNNDSATATPYGRTNWVENFADAGRFAMSDMTTRGGIISSNGNWSALAAQNADYRQRLERVIFPEGFPRGGLCTAKVSSSPAVLKSTGKEPYSQDGMRGKKGKPSRYRVRGVPAGGEDVPLMMLPDFGWEPVVYRGP